MERTHFQIQFPTGSSSSTSDFRRIQKSCLSLCQRCSVCKQSNEIDDIVGEELLHDFSSQPIVYKTGDNKSNFQHHIISNEALHNSARPTHSFTSSDTVIASPDGKACTSILDSHKRVHRRHLWEELCSMLSSRNSPTSLIRSKNGTTGTHSGEKASTNETGECQSSVTSGTSCSQEGWTTAGKRSLGQDDDGEFHGGKRPRNGPAIRNKNARDMR
jgi:hypothetical protein